MELVPRVVPFFGTELFGGLWRSWLGNQKAKPLRHLDPFGGRLHTLRHTHINIKSYQDGSSPPWLHAMQELAGNLRLLECLDADQLIPLDGET